MELPGSSWTLVSFETDMEVTPALTEAPATLTFSVEGEQADSAVAAATSRATP